VGRRGDEQAEMMGKERMWGGIKEEKGGGVGGKWGRRSGRRGGGGDERGGGARGRGVAKKGGGAGGGGIGEGIDWGEESKEKGGEKRFGSSRPV